MRSLGLTTLSGILTYRVVSYLGESGYTYTVINTCPASESDLLYTALQNQYLNRLIDIFCIHAFLFN